MRQLATWDTVGASGYKSTDKANAVGLESFAGEEHLEYEIKIMEDGNLLIDQIALENFRNTDLNEIFGQSSIQKIIQSRTIVKSDLELQTKFPNLYPKAMFEEYFKEGR